MSEKNRASLLASFRFALDGLLRPLNSERNMKVHWLCAIAVMLVGMALDLDLAARASLLVSVGLVLSLEALNTALEAFVDLYSREYQREAMIAKDSAAAAVFLAALASAAIFADILLHRWAQVEAHPKEILRTTFAGLPLLGSTAFVLFRERNPWLLAGAAFLSTTLLLPLVVYSHDAVFSTGAAALVASAFWARRKNMS